MRKILNKVEYSLLKDTFKNKKVVLCHGVFDLLHPGHIEHFKEAKEIGDILVVSVTSKKYVRKGPDRPYFNDQMRLTFLSAIEYIDYIILAEEYTAEGIIELVEPNFYVKGIEYIDASSDISGKIGDEIRLVKKHGGDIYFTTGNVFSSTKLINNHFSSLDASVKIYMREFHKQCNIDEIRKLADMIKTKKVLVIGDSFFDIYHYCDVSSRISEENRYVLNEKKSEKYICGALYMGSFIAEFAEQVSVITTLNEKDKELVDEMNLSKLDLNINYREDYETVIRDNYIEQSDNSIIKFNLVYPYRKSNDDISKTDEDICFSSYDCVLVVDYGFGFFNKTLIDIIQNKAKFLAVNCKDMSFSEHVNTILKYKRADVFVVDEHQLNMISISHGCNVEETLKNLEEKLSGKGWILYNSGKVNILNNDETITIPSLWTSVEDFMGVNDDFFVVASLFASLGINQEISGLLGNIARALASKIIGHSAKNEKVNIIRFASTLFNI